jgi:hypothetical protein
MKGRLSFNRPMSDLPQPALTLAWDYKRIIFLNARRVNGLMM